MQKTIAVPHSSVYAPLIAQASEVEEKTGYRVIVTTESECARLLRTNAVELALLTPLGYAQGVTNSDYRIIPTLCTSLSGWTNHAGIFFQERLGSISSCASATPDDFLMVIGRIILDEQFDVAMDMIHQQGTTAELLREYSSVVAWRTNEPSSAGMDISEEWNIAFERALPLALWCCREEYIEESVIADITRMMAMPDILIEEELIEQTPSEGTFPREGKILRMWSEQTEEDLMFVLNMLYYYQYVPEIPAVKLYGRD
jgi:hypothetical protein